MRIAVTHSPAWEIMMQAWPATVGSILMRAAVTFVLQNTELIHRGLKSDGSKQKENSRRWREYKQRKHGHQIPLRFDDVLSNPANWLINNRKAGEFIGPYSRRAARTPALSKPSVWRTARPEIASVTLPRSRQVIALDLRAMGYDIPFWVSPEIEAIIKYDAYLEIQSTADLLEYGFRARFRAW